MKMFREKAIPYVPKVLLIVSKWPNKSQDFHFFI